MLVGVNDIATWLEGVLSHDFVVGLVVATFVLVFANHTYHKIKNNTKKSEKLYDQFNEVYELTQSTLTHLPHTLNDIVIKLDKINTNLSQIITTLSVIDRNTSQDQSITHITNVLQQIVELSKAIGELRNQIKLLEDKILSKLKRLEGADYDL